MSIEEKENSPQPIAPWRYRKAGAWALSLTLFATATAGGAMLWRRHVQHPACYTNITLGENSSGLAGASTHGETHNGEVFYVDAKRDDSRGPTSLEATISEDDTDGKPVEYSIQTTENEAPTRQETFRINGDVVTVTVNANTGKVTTYCPETV